MLKCLANISVIQIRPTFMLHACSISAAEFFQMRSDLPMTLWKIWMCKEGRMRIQLSNRLGKTRYHYLISAFRTGKKQK